MTARAGHLTLQPLAGGTVVRRDSTPAISIAPTPRVTFPMPVRQDSGERPEMVIGREGKSAIVVRQDGTVVRRDGWGGSWKNEAYGLGGVADREDETVFVPGIPLPAFIVDALLQYNGMARRIAEREPYDCTREGFTLGPDPDAEKLRKYACTSISGRDEDDADDGVLNLIAKARTVARAYGGAAIILLVDDRTDPAVPVDPSKPLNSSAIRQVLGARVVTRWEISPLERDRDIASSRVGKPVVYSISIPGAAAMRVHYTRVIIVQGMELPEHIMARQNGWGGSVFELLWSALMRYQVVMKMLPTLTRRQTQGVWTMDGLGEAIGAGYKDNIVERFEGQQTAMSIGGDIAIPKGDTYSIETRSVAGMGEVIEPLQMDVVANADGLPKVLLFNETPGGIRSGESPEIVGWYDLCSGRQTAFYSPPVKRMLRVVALAKEGPCAGTVPKMELVWNQLWQPSQTEKDASEKARAERRSIDINAAVVSPEEARTDPDVANLYPGLDRGKVPATPGMEPEGVDTGADPTMPAANEPAAEKVADLALNGAQVSSLIDIVSQVNADTLTYGQGVAVLGAAFPQLKGREASILGPEGARPPAGAAAPGAPGVVADDDPEAAALASASQPPTDPASPQQAASAWGVPTLTITRMIRSGELPHWKIGTRTIVSLSAVGAMAKAHERPPVPELESEEPAAE